MRRPSQRHFAAENLDPRLRAGLVGHWIGGGSGLTLPDHSGYGRHGALNGPLWTLGEGGRRHALSFDGVNDRVDMPSVTSFASTESHSFAAWVRFGAFGSSYGWILNYGSYSDGSSLVIRINQAAYFYAGGNSVDFTGPVLSQGQWYHIAAVYDGSTNKVRLYVDGVRAGESSALGGWSAVAATPRIGGWQPVNNHWFNGTIEDVRAYSRRLSDAEVGLLAQPAFLPVVPRRWFVLTQITTTATSSVSTWVSPTASTRASVAASPSIASWASPTASTKASVSASPSVSTWVVPNATIRIPRILPTVSVSRTVYSTIPVSRTVYDPIEVS